MKLIKELCEMIEEELEGAERYAKCAVKRRESDPTLAKVFYDISMQEMQHVTLLHGEIVKLIEAHRKEKGEPPETMMALYEYLHERQICDANVVKVYQAQYKGT